MKTREQLDLEQIKLKFELECITQALDKFRFGEAVLLQIKKNIQDINLVLGR